MSTPVELMLLPVLMGRRVQRVTDWIWPRAALVVGGSVVLVRRSP
jgi:hypothetical protein